MAMHINSTAALEVCGLTTRLDDEEIHHDLSLLLASGTLMGVVGKSGCGKSTLLRSLLHLQPADYNNLTILGKQIDNAQTHRQMMLHIGMMFQKGALFGNLSIWQNVAFPMRLHRKMAAIKVKDVAFSKCEQLGLTASMAEKKPLQLSGGMLKRAALARALALDPKLLFLDEPTAGLDPESASQFDHLIDSLKKQYGMSILLVTHDLDSLWTITDKVAFIARKKILACAPIADLAKHSAAELVDYFDNSRARRFAQMDSEENA